MDCWAGGLGTALGVTGVGSGGGIENRSESPSVGIATARSFPIARLGDAVKPLVAGAVLLGALQLKPALVGDGAAAGTALCITGSGSPG
jgi:hypothetical protein